MFRVVRWWRHVHFETVVCGLESHALGDAVLDGPDGGKLARCLRCDSWIPAPTHSVDTVTRKGAPRRGKELRQALVLRLIAIDRGLHAIAFALIAIALIVLELKLGPLQTWARETRDHLSSAVSQTGRDPSRDFLTTSLDRLLRLNKRSFPVLIGTAITYAVVEGAEAFGLWLEKRWAEYLTAIATAGFLPFELHELLDRVTAFRIGALIVNVVVLVYLVWSKRLFGIGPRPADDTSA